MNDKIHPDKLYFLNPENGTEPIGVNSKYDRIDHFGWINYWVVKVMDDEKGMMALSVDEKTARDIAGFALLPIVERDFIYQSEHEVYLKVQEKIMDEWSD